MPLTRREFISSSIAAAFAGGRLLAALPHALQESLARGRLLGTLPLGTTGGRSVPPLDTLLWSGLDARLFTNLSTLTGDTLITPNERFFVRTAAPRRLPSSWILQVGGVGIDSQTLSVETLERETRSMGVHLLECSGNSDPTNFGLMSAATWEGVPIAAILDRLRRPSPAARILVSGLDDEQRSRTSVPGASWIFSRDDLERAGAFLATRMNGAPLPAHHGFPLRLVVPGWFGCACIKWVQAVTEVPDDEPPTSQMREFATRTHQDGVPALAREFVPAVIDHAAMPVRVEKWLIDGRLRYRVVGILWGGARPTNALSIRFRHTDPWIPVTDCPLPASTTTWALWSHEWRPPGPGRYQIVLRIDDRSLRTWRLDMFFYTREVEEV